MALVVWLREASLSRQVRSSEARKQAMTQLRSESFDDAVSDIARRLSTAPNVDVGEWQATDAVALANTTLELEDVSLVIPINPTPVEWAAAVQPNMPWSEEHFQERVSGIPHNPPPSHVRWPYAQRNNDQHREEEKFSHTYPERFWPRMDLDSKLQDMEGELSYGFLSPRHGIRFEYGDLDDLVSLLKNRPLTRQAYLPIWFPEDLHAANVRGQRVPCSLGYHFLKREGRLKITYYIRSCDFRRHFRDDVYMAGRLCQWVADRVGAVPGNLVMHISSLHIFAHERSWIEREVSELESS